jgi:hypothetical protein
MSGHSKQADIDPNKTYEENEIKLKGIIGFAVGLFLLIVVTFILMLFLESAMESSIGAEADKASPMSLTKQERLPPEPRLQAAPGFGVGQGDNRVNLELTAPQAEYRELKKRWDKEIKEGQKDEKTGTIMTLPVEEGMKRLVASGVKARPDEEAKASVAEATTIVSQASGGRTMQKR